MNAKIYAFEKLEVWQLSRLFVSSVYKLIARFPHEEKMLCVTKFEELQYPYHLILAEGSSRAYPKEQKHFIEIAYSSLMEVYCQLILAIDLGYAISEQVNEIKVLIDRISQMLNALRTSLNKRINT